MKNIKSAFTIGEILVAVAIVGLVAALSIPNLNKNINEDKYIALMKSTMSQLDAAVVKVIAEYGSVENAKMSCQANPTPVERNACFGELLVRNLDVKKDCSSTNTSCYSTGELKDIYGDTIKDYSSYEGCAYTFILSNGVSVCIRNEAPGLDIDVDGPNSGPNVRGVDSYDFKIDENGLSYLDPIEMYHNGVCWDNLSQHDCELWIVAINKFYNNTRRDIDRGFNAVYDSVAWAFLNGNMDYLRCADQLKWQSKKTCD